MKSLTVAISNATNAGPNSNVCSHFLQVFELFLDAFPPSFILKVHVLLGNIAIMVDYLFCFTSIKPFFPGHRISKSRTLSSAP